MRVGPVCHLRINVGGMVKASTSVVHYESKGLEIACSISFRSKVLSASENVLMQLLSLSASYCSYKNDAVVTPHISGKYTKVKQSVKRKKRSLL